MNPKPESLSSEATQDRREFVKACCAVAVGGAATAVPVVAGLHFLTDPVRRNAGSSLFVRVASLSSLPEDGQPRKFSVIADRSDAWNRYPQVPIGAVYLRRTGPETVEALNILCPHAGCAVDFQPEHRHFLCPCHNSSFALDGAVVDESSPSARALDSLEVELRGGGEIWVKFMNFQAGKAEKIPLT
jgi:menaquinol-cytochrome c reductase iron-sulfur subunit